MLEGLKKYWNCSTSEAVRRAIVYTYSKMVARVEPMDEEALRKALAKALAELEKTV